MHSHICFLHDTAVAAELSSDDPVFDGVVSTCSPVTYVHDALVEGEFSSHDVDTSSDEMLEYVTSNVHSKTTADLFHGNLCTMHSIKANRDNNFNVTYDVASLPLANDSLYIHESFVNIDSFYKAINEAFSLFMNDDNCPIHEPALVYDL